WLPQGLTINSDRYCASLCTLKCKIQQCRKGKWFRNVLLHDNARPHTSQQAQAELQSLGFTVLPHPPYSPNLVPSDYALFREMKNPLRGHRFPDSDALHDAVREWVRDTPKQWFHEAIWKLLERWQRCIDLHGECVERAEV
ncbi:hypothetical protein L798_01919, partial [Zootermopsis nevadensis]